MTSPFGRCARGNHCARTACRPRQRRRVTTGRDDLAEEGQAQQDKADAQKDAAKKEAEADSARAGAKAAEERQQANQ
jgi:hypothetical protein